MYINPSGRNLSHMSLVYTALVPVYFEWLLFHNFILLRNLNVGQIHLLNWVCGGVVKEENGTLKEE